MEKYNSKITTTFWGSLIKHPHAVFQSIMGLQTTRITGKLIEEAYADLKRYIYENIIELKTDDIEKIEKNLKARVSYENKKNSQKVSIPSDLENEYNTFEDESLNDLEKYYEEFELEENKNREEIKLEKKDLSSIDISRINLIKIDETAEIDTKIFPKSYLCPYCKYYVIFDDDYIGNVMCPYCKAKLNKEVKLQQCNYIYVCPICAKIEEVAPFWEYDSNGLKSTHNRPFKCLDKNCNGYLKLNLNEKYLYKSYWYCSECDLNYTKFIPSESKEYRVVNFHHECKIYDRSGIPLSIKYMFNRNSARVINPLLFEYITIGDKVISYKTFRENFEKDKFEGITTWELNDLSAHFKTPFIRDYNIENVFLVRKIKTQTCCFGYEANSQDEKYVSFKRRRFFKTPRGEYNVYFFENEGNGLVIKMNKKGIIKKLVDLNLIPKPENYELCYDILINRFREHLENQDLQDFLKDESVEVKLFKALHFFSHVILESVIKKIGIDVFRTKILLQDAAILIYEIEGVLSGGLVQLTLNEQSGNAFFSLFCYEIKPKIEDCYNDCEDHCQKCSFINDFYCRPLIYFENEKKKWFPPNSLLSRNFANQIILK